jgi:signal transduction histidine kinase
VSELESIRAARPSPPRGESDEDAAGLFEALPLGAMVVDPASGRVLRANQRLTSMIGEEVAGQSVVELVAPGEQAALLEALRIVVSDRRELVLERHLQVRGSAPIPVELRTALTARGRLLLTVREVGPDSRTAELLRAEALKRDDLLAMVAHELRNPISPIRMAVQLLEREPHPPGSRVPWGLEVIGRQLGQVTRLIDELLDVVRLAQGRLTIEKRPLELGEIASAALAASPQLDAAQRQALLASLPRQGAPCEGDAGRLAQVIGAMLAFAARTTRQGGAIDVSLTREDDTWHLLVRDHGPGLPAALLERLFDPYAHADRALGRGFGGLGISLALAEGLARLHGGVLTASRTTAEGGTALLLCLPAAPLPAGG